jgi:parallel beta-helix repeat protein
MMMKQSVGFAAILLLLGSTVASGRIINVPGQYATIQAGINHSEGGDTVLVQPRIYQESVIFGGHLVTLGSLYLTTADTNYISSTTIFGSGWTTAVRFVNGEDSLAAIVGFKIINGDTTYGGGIRCQYNSSPTIRHNLIMANRGSRGAGICCMDNCNATIRGNHIINNDGQSGGGIYCRNASPIIVDNYITGNAVTLKGGGIYCGENSNPLIRGNVIIGNQSNDDGGGIACDASNPLIENNQVSDNISGSGLWGGGGGIFAKDSRPIIRYNLISRNSCVGIGGELIYGGGVYCNNSNALIIGNMIMDNSAVGSQSHGGGIYCIYSDALIVNNSIVRNSAGASGGAMQIHYSDPLITNNTISGNVANWGGGAYIYRCNPCLAGNIIWADSSVLTGQEIDLSSATPIISYCDIEFGWEGEGNFDLDPLFRDPENGDFHLMAVECGDPSNSPCIDAGPPNFLDSLLDCSWGLGTFASDMGAYGGGVASGIVIEVPYNYETIQEAIDHSYDGDTVLVSYGTYHENIDFRGRDIILGSFFLTTGDTELVPLTIIDGDTSGSVVTFNNGEDTTAALVGFTIRNGLSDYGGGIYCDGASPSIRNNWIVDNVANNSGGGIFCENAASPKIQNNIIRGNNAQWGGAIHCWQECESIISNNAIQGNSAMYGGGILCNITSNATIANNIILENTADIDGGGIYCWINSNATITNNTLSRNVAFSGGGMYCQISNPNITNTIFWADSAQNSPEIYNYAGSPVITYCDIQSGWQGAGNLNINPLFRDPDNGDYHLMAVECGDLYDSPCIDHGNPSITDLILDCWHGLGTALSDMGAYAGRNGGWVDVEIDSRERQISPHSIALFQNYPNPFNEATVIQYELPNSQSVHLLIYNILGQKVATLSQGVQSSGNHRVIWNASEVASGIYLALIRSGGFSKSIKMVVLK